MSAFLDDTSDNEHYVNSCARIQDRRVSIFESRAFAEHPTIPARFARWYRLMISLRLVSPVYCDRPPPSKRPNDMLQIPRKVEYALRAAVFLARERNDQPVSFREIAEAQDVPPDFMAKILRSLVENELLTSTRGANGGYRLAKAASQVTFLDVIEAADSPISLNICCDQGEGCQLSDSCSMRDIWQRGEDAMKDVFRSVYLSDLSCRSELMKIFGPRRELSSSL